MRFVILLFLLLASCGCDSENRRPIAPNHEVVIVTGNSLLHQPGSVSLYYVATPKSRKLLWSYVTGRSPGVIEELAVFNGGLSDEKRWKVYPALLACREQGPPAEISKALSRKAKEGVEYSFRLVGCTNGNFEVSGVQRPPVDTTKPLDVELVISKDEILRAIEETRTRGEKRRYEGIDYFIEP